VVLFDLSNSQNEEFRGLGSSIWGQVHQVGSQWVKSVQNSVDEIGKVAKVLAGDASDAVSTVASARIDDYIPNLEDDVNYLQSQRQQLAPPRIQYRQNFSPAQGLASSMLRMVGLDEHKLGMMALNILVYLAEYLAQNFLGMNTSEMNNEIPQYRSIVQEQGIIAGMVQLTQDANAKSAKIKEKLLSPEVTEQLIDYVPNQFMGTDTSCIQMFLCKIEPAFWSMQTTTKNYSGISIRRSLNSNLNNWLETVYQRLPDLKTLRQFGGRCLEKFPKCQLLNSF